MKIAAALALAVALTLLAGRAYDYELAPEIAQAHLVTVAPKPSRSLLENRAARQRENLAHARYVCAHGARANRRWHCAAKVWIRRELRETMNALRPPTRAVSALSPVAAIYQAFGSEGAKAVRVAACESGLNVYAVGNRYGSDPYYGLFQQGSYSRSRYGFGWSALAQAQAAKRHRDAEGWSPWPTCGLR